MDRLGGRMGEWMNGWVDGIGDEAGGRMNGWTDEHPPEDRPSALVTAVQKMQTNCTSQ